MEELKNSVFVKKYQPVHVADVIGDFVPKITKYLENPMALPNFLFSSYTPGTGKTTLAYAIITDLDCDKLVLNSSKDRTMEVVRERVGFFVNTMSTKQGIKKCVFLDEFDGMLSQSQKSLRNMMETYADNCFFILTCNYANKVLPAIRSRCVEIDFTKPNRTEIAKYLIGICKNENIQCDTEGIKKLIDLHYPSIRDMVSHIQDILIEGVPLTKDTVKARDEKFAECWNAFLQKKVGFVREKILRGEIIAEELNAWLFERVFEEALKPDSTFGATKVGNVVRVLAQNERDFKVGCQPNIVFIASCFDIIRNF